MRKLSFVVVFLLVQLNVFAQSAELEVGYDLAQEMLQWEEMNPTRQSGIGPVFEKYELCVWL